jgi:hypothetical protein
MPYIIVRFVLVIALCTLVSGRVWSATGKEGPLSKLDHALIALYENQQSSITQGQGVGSAPYNRLLRVSEGRVQIDAVAAGDVETLRADLEALGMQGAVAFGRVVSGRLPISALGSMAALDSLLFARPTYAITRVGRVTSQGDRSMRADVARTSFGVNGTGVTVGVLSDSFNCLGRADTDVATGDLSPVAVIQEVDDCEGAADEGRAMLQLIHDVAPGASLAFATGFAPGMAGFASNILALQAAGARVIVDDVGDFSEPMFQDGIIAQAINTVKGKSVAYFSAAANLGRQSYESSFRPGSLFDDGAFPSAAGAPQFFGGTAHDFDPGPVQDVFQRITIPAGAELTISLQWDSPFASVCSGCPGSPNDIDIYLFNDPPTKVISGGVNANIGGDAVEVFTFTNPADSKMSVFNLMIIHSSGPSPQLIKYIWNSLDDVTINEFDTRSSTIFGHANAAGAAAVGAAFYGDTPEFGVAPPVLEPYSSAGFTPILFDITGNRLVNPRIRLKPEFVAPDGSNTTEFFFDSPDIEGDGFPNFFGTSAAAPHAAAVAALMLQAVPTTTPQRVYEVLKATAVDIGSQGPDFDSGLGLIQADRALALLRFPVVNALVQLDSVRGFFFPPGAGGGPLLPYAPAGTFLVNATFTNTSTMNICNVAFEVVELTGQNVMLDHRGSLVGGEGSILRYPIAGPVQHLLKGTTERFFSFEIGLGNKNRFRFFVNMLGDPTNGSCPSAPSETNMVSR